MGRNRGVLAVVAAVSAVAAGGAFGLGVAQAGGSATTSTTGTTTVTSTAPTTAPTTTTPPTTTPPTTPPTGDGNWCSPGFWKNNPIAVAETGVDMSQSYNALFDPDVDGTKKGGVASPTLQQVLDSPQYYGGEAFNTVGDLLSGAHPDVNFTGERVEDSCPLSADASR